MFFNSAAFIIVFENYLRLAVPIAHDDTIVIVILIKEIDLRARRFQRAFDIIIAKGAIQSRAI